MWGHLVRPINNDQGFQGNCLSFSMVGRNNFFWLHKRSGNKSLLGFRMASHFQEEAQAILDSAGIPFTTKTKHMVITTDTKTLEKNKESFEKFRSYYNETKNRIRRD